MSLRHRELFIRGLRQYAFFGLTACFIFSLAHDARAAINPNFVSAVSTPVSNKAVIYSEKATVHAAISHPVSVKAQVHASTPKVHSNKAKTHSSVAKVRSQKVEARSNKATIASSVSNPVSVPANPVSEISTPVSAEANPVSVIPEAVSVISYPVAVIADPFVAYSMSGTYYEESYAFFPEVISLNKAIYFSWFENLY